METLPVAFWPKKIDNESKHQSLDRTSFKRVDDLSSTDDFTACDFKLFIGKGSTQEKIQETLCVPSCTDKYYIIFKSSRQIWLYNYDERLEKVVPWSQLTSQNDSFSSMCIHQTSFVHNYTLSVLKDCNLKNDSISNYKLKISESRIATQSTISLPYKSQKIAALAS